MHVIKDSGPLAKAFCGDDASILFLGPAGSLKLLVQSLYIIIFMRRVDPRARHGVTTRESLCFCCCCFSWFYSLLPLFAT